MTLIFDSRDRVRQWKRWFENSGVKPFFTKAIIESEPPKSSSFYAELPVNRELQVDKPSEQPLDSSEDESEFPEHLKPQVKLMHTLVDSHYLIMKKKFK